jgi:hypothetical protein
MRPTTLKEVAELVAKGEPFDVCLANFLDDFYDAPTAEALMQMPPLLEPQIGKKGKVQDAYLAAVAEELARKYEFAAPKWINDESRRLHQPWFASSLASLRAVLILESPAAFRARNLFVSDNALTRV